MVKERAEEETAVAHPMGKPRLKKRVTFCLLLWDRYDYIMDCRTIHANLKLTDGH